MSDAGRRREPGELLREIHAALDLLERNLNQLPWRADTGSHIDLVVQLRNRVIATYPHDAGLAGDVEPAFDGASPSAAVGGER
ncbi:MAG: hypothetical protein AB1601_04880 [Planctomycetota bacterium]